MNDLVVKFIELSKDQFGNNLLVMERLYPLEYRALDFEIRATHVETFELKLRELHSSGFVFLDLAGKTRPLYSTNPNNTNYMLTIEGGRLIDTGEALLRDDIGISKFEEFVNQEIFIFQEVKKSLLLNIITSRLT